MFLDLARRQQSGILIAVTLFLAACATPPSTASVGSDAGLTTTPAPSATAVPASSRTPTAAPTDTSVPTSTLTPMPTLTSTTSPTTSPTSTVTATPTATPVPPPAAATPTVPSAVPGAGRPVTVADDGQTIVLNVGASFLLQLGDAYIWTVTVADPSIVSRQVNILVVRGAQGVYVAHKAGQTTLTAVGNPPCRSAQPPCAAPSRLFRVTIVVH
jgi:hypothetical protein